MNKVKWPVWTQGNKFYNNKFLISYVEIEPIIAKDNKVYVDKSNYDEPILYIIVNKDAKLSHGELIANISHITSKMSNKDFNNDSNIDLFDEWLNTYNGYGNTVILEASEAEIYANMFEKSEYVNVEVDYIISDMKKVAHHNWKLTKPKHLVFAFFGIKKDMPKWIRTLKTLKLVK